MILTINGGSSSIKFAADALSAKRQETMRNDAHNLDVAKSVSRVGGEAQQAACRAVAGHLKLACARFEELETFAQFGARLDEDTRALIRE